MKVALLADIHSNHRALEAVLTDARSQGVEHLCICGDFIGYGHRPVEVFDLLDAWSYDACQGNHDALIGSPEKSKPHYGSGLRLAIEHLDEDRKSWLMSLAHPVDLEIGGRKIRLCHGSPWDRDSYVYPDAEAHVWLKMAEGDFDLIAFGHTHYPVVRDEGTTRIVNPGSVGQQRNGISGAHWAVWNTVTNHVQEQVTPYDPAEAIRDAQHYDPEIPYLAEIHLRGTA